MIDTLHMNRKGSTIILVVIIFLLGIPCSLANGPVLGDYYIAGYNFFDFMSFIAENVLMPLGALLMCIFIEYVWEIDKACKEITSDGKYKFYTKKFFIIMIKYIAPIMILVVWLNAIGVIDLVKHLF